MSSLYRRKNSPFWWANVIDPVSGKRVNISTKVRAGTTADYRKALAFVQSKDRAHQALNRDGSEWSSWVPLLLETRYATSPLSKKRITISWNNIFTFLSENKITHPIQLTRDHCFQFLHWRKKAGWFKGMKGTPIRHNTATYDLRILRMIMNEAMDRQMITYNPANRLNIKQEPTREKAEATPEQVAKIRGALAEKASRAAITKDRRLAEIAEFLRISFEIAYHQGIRISETWFPLKAVNWRDKVIRIHQKGNKYFDAPINPTLEPMLKSFKDEGRTFTYPEEIHATQHWFSVFKALRRHDPSFKNVSFHSLRVGGISRFRRAGIPEKIAMMMVGHSSTTVHRDYQRAPFSELHSYWGAVAQVSEPKKDETPTSSANPEHGTPSS